MKMMILAIGKAKGAETAFIDEYKKRLGDAVSIQELVYSKNLPPEEQKKAEGALILNAIPKSGFVVLLDEHGKNMTSRDFADSIQKWESLSVKNLVFIIGGAFGVSDEVKQKADAAIAFGSWTWAHKLVRVMLMEQIYRAKQILQGHPYHKE
ncbi:MAG: 23S rRNA (pseudouridine(1915)-N(3))-methyltransferase RlmH [Alphaproteobacteria bacterium]|nr:23S rRNA (pseudouridine(1915)-N(3))-methyltransferase RlmH [Alphaproteobacteria bacterium]MCL2505984.1 23S rRNA (pseudouridine(1915)-N(3))-methyltransferase RlmH [Alphaproteobacteria bacterium]